MSNLATIFVLTLGWVVALYIRVGQRYPKNPKGQPSFPLPPGPPGLPWIGNVIGLNTSKPWLSYSDWAKTYGDLVYSRLFGNDMIIIHSEKVARDLLENRSKNYSDRPNLITNELGGIGFNSVMLPYGDKWRLHRRFFHQTFRADSVHRFASVQHRKACQLLRQLLHAPERFADHVFEYTASVMLNSVYDYDPRSENDDMINITADVLRIVVPANCPEVAFLVEAFPALLYFPSWFPGMSFKMRMATARELSKVYIEKPFAYSLPRMRNSSTVPSMVHDALQYAETNGTQPDGSWMTNLKEAAATAFLAASETSDSVLMTFFLMMVTNPDAQKQAQAQIDDVVGNTRLPTINDRSSLPYIDAILREILRCNPPAPLLIPHASTDDDVYNGFHIPKGTIVMVNIWSMMHDESRYPNPDKFLPERHLDDDGSLKPENYEDIVFGFGRRVCVGRHFADMSVWSLIAKVLAAFKILNPLDENGAEVPVEPKYSGGPGVHPLPFRCRIAPRMDGMDAEKLEELITASGD